MGNGLQGALGGGVDVDGWNWGRMDSVEVLGESEGIRFEAIGGCRDNKVYDSNDGLVVNVDELSTCHRLACSSPLPQPLMV